MGQLNVLFIVCTSIFVSSTVVEQSCGVNEQLKEGIECKSDCCPGQDCPDPSATCKFGQTCGLNEELKEGKDCKSDCCPGQDCPDPCATCKCDLMYHRLSNGTCIPSRECPPIPCPKNEHFDSCPVCNENCENADASGIRCISVGYDKTTVICQPACRCDDNYWRDDDENCVYYTECTQDECQ